MVGMFALSRSVGIVLNKTGKVIVSRGADDVMSTGGLFEKDSEAMMKGSEWLKKIDLLIDEGNRVQEDPDNGNDRDVTSFCGAVKSLVEDIYGSEHPFHKRCSAPSGDGKHCVDEGLAVLKTIRNEVEYYSHMGH
jgi:hypothetical protein